MFKAISDYLGFNDGLFVKEKEDFIPAETKVIRLCFDGILPSITVKHLKPNSNVVFKLNGSVNREFMTDDEGYGHVQLDHPIDLMRIHCPQLCVEGNGKPIYYCFGDGAVTGVD